MIKKAAAVVIVIGVLIGFEMNRIYVPDNFEKPLNFKVMAIAFRAMAGLVGIRSV